MFDLAGLESERLLLRWVSSAEGKLFADYVTEANETLAKLGKFDAAQYRLPLAAVRLALSTPRVRWLTGMEKKLVEHENVYGYKTDSTKYKAALNDALQQELEKALVLEALTADAGQSVRQISETTGLGLHTVSNCLVALEHEGRAEVEGYDGQHPKFIRQAA